MKNNELRVGNLFHPCSTKGGIFISVESIVWAVGSIDKFGKIAVIEPEKQDNIYLHCREASPISLSKEWLLKFGAKPIYASEFYLKLKNLDAEINFRSSRSNEILTTIQGEDMSLILNNIKYVHQLQNLYFALTGEELSLKEAVDGES